MRIEPFVSTGVIVVPADWIRPVTQLLSQDAKTARFAVIAGGASRQESVGKGLAALSRQVDLVLVHDAARPFVSSGVIQAVLAGADQHGGCIPVLPVPDTVKLIRDGQVCETLDRERLGLAQTPQGFRRKWLQEAFELAEREGFRGTDEAMLVEHLGRPVWTVPGDPENLKVTWPHDLTPAPASPRRLERGSTEIHDR